MASQPQFGTDDKVVEQTAAFGADDDVVEPDDDRGIVESTVDFVTGRTRGRGDLPELGSLGDVAPKEMGDLAIAAGFFTTPDIQARKDIIRKNVPGVTFDRDEHGNTVVNLPDGRQAFLNAPGLSLQDFADLGSEVVKFLPAAKLAGVGQGVLSRAALAGAGAGATSVAEDVAAIPQGSEQGIDPLRAVITAGTGAALEPVVSLGIGIGRFFADRLSRIVRRSAREQPGATGAERDIPLTKGQREGDPRQLIREENLRTRGDEAGKIIRDFDERQTQRLREITNELQEELAASGKAPVIGGEREGGGIIAEEIGESAQRMLLAVDEAFDEAARHQASVLSEGLALLGGVRQRLKNRGFIIDPDIFPSTDRAMRQIEDLIPKSGAEGSMTARTLEEINTKRKVIGRLINAAPNSEDRLGATLIKKELDGFLDDVFNKALFEGDAQALEALKSARLVRREFGDRFEARPTRTTSGRTIQDEAGKIIEQIVEKRATNEQIVNAVFGAGRLFGKRTASDVIRRMRTAVDDPSQIDSALKQLALRRLVRPAMRDGGFDPGRYARALDDAMERNESVMREVFAPQELAALRKFRDDALKTQRAERVLNTQEFSDKLTTLLSRLGIVIGLQRGGIGFGSLGGGVGRSVGRGIGRGTARRQAERAVSPDDILPGRPNSTTMAALLAAARGEDEAAADSEGNAR